MPPPKPSNPPPPHAPSQRKRARRATPPEGHPVIIKDQAPPRIHGGPAYASAGYLGLSIIC